MNNSSDFKIFVKVLQSHFDEGIPEDPHCCPLALGLKRMGFKDSQVFKDHAVVNGRVFKLSDGAQEFVKIVDSEIPESVNHLPYTYTLTLVQS